MSMSVYLRARSALDLVSNQGCSSCHVCSKNPSSLQLCNTVCGSVFSQCEIQAQLCTRRCSVAWFKKKNEIKQVPILCTYSLLFLLFGLNGEFPREGGAHLFADAMQHVQKAKLFFFFFWFLDLWVSSVTRKQPI